MKKIMIFIGSYLPGTKSAGVTTSMKNMIETLHHEYEFYIVTADRDIGETEPYTTVPLEQWTKQGFANIYYSGQYLKSLTAFKKIINSVDVDLYYFNGFYNIQDTARALLLLKLGLVPEKPIIIAPRGIFNMGEFGTHEFKRMIYRFVFKAVGLSRKAHWHATAKIEEKAILGYFPNSSKKVFLAGNLSGIEIKPREKYLDKIPGEVKIIFISRISEKKNIKFIIETLKKMKGQRIECDLYGMIGTEADKVYWEKCEKEAKILPEYIHFNYKGEVCHDKVPELFHNHHLFFFPTFGENYGHVIAESIANGCPILLSDTTPWNMLPEYNAGWVYSLSDITSFEKTLQQIIDMEQEEWEMYAKSSWEAAKLLVDNKKLADAHRFMFDSL